MWKGQKLNKVCKLFSSNMAIASLYLACLQKKIPDFNNNVTPSKLK